MPVVREHGVTLRSQRRRDRAAEAAAQLNLIARPAARRKRPANTGIAVLVRDVERQAAGDHRSSRRAASSRVTPIRDRARLSTANAAPPAIRMSDEGSGTGAAKTARLLPTKRCVETELTTPLGWAFVVPPELKTLGRFWRWHDAHAKADP